MDLLLFYLLCLKFIITAFAQSNTRSLPAYNSSNFNGESFSGGVQLLILSSNFTSQGIITEWTAHVTGDTTASGSIEFQIFEPAGDGVYKLKYGNSYLGNNAEGSMITRPVIALNGPFIPVRPGDIVGVYLPPSIANLNLLYEDNGNDEVYYWNGVATTICNYSLCSGQSRSALNILIGWEFMPSSLTSFEDTLDLFKASNPMYCQGSIEQCITGEPSVTTTNTLVQSSSLLSSPSLILSVTTVTSSILSQSSLMPLTTPSITQTQSSIPTTTTTPGGSPFAVAPELIAAFSVVLLLFLVVLGLIIAIGVCCFLRRKPIIESSAVPGFDNPDYNGVVSEKPSLGALEMTYFADEPKALHSPTATNPVVTQTVATASPGPQFDDSHYYSPAGLDHNTHPTSPLSPGSDTANKQSQKSFKHSKGTLPPPSILLSDDNHNRVHNSTPEQDNNSILSPNESLASKHYYTSPTTDVSNLSFPIVGGIYDTIDESHSEVPSTHDQEIEHGYDQIHVPKKKEAGTLKGKLSNDDPFNVYAYVPTLEQRKVLDWRYELPLDTAYNKLTFFEEQSQFWAPASTASGLYEQLATNKYREIPRDKIVVSTPLGQGQFGSVSKGVWASPDGRHEVAIKTLKSDATEDDKLKLLQEAAIMGQFSNKNVVRVEGVVTLGDPIMLVLEYMPRGDLRSYLRSIKPKHGRWHPPTNLPKLLLRFCRDISLGMRYLAGKSFVHRDLAARNVLLSRELTCKIGDFGMARDLMQDEGNYYTSSGGIIPIKWTAPEALNFRKYSTDSDVWSYGMVLFEIWSLGHKPFSELSNPIVIALINSKHCQAPPPGCPRPMYKLMVDCWHPEHSKRPPFTKIVTFLDSSSDPLLGWNREDNIRGRNAHILGAPLDDSGDLYLDLQRLYQQSMLQTDSGRQRSKSNY